MKYNIYILIMALFGLGLMPSCKKKLEEYNPSGLTANTVYAKAAGFETLVNAAYTYSRFWYGKEEGYLASEMGTDIWTSGTGDPYPQFTQYNNLQSNGDPLPWLWNNLYAGVNLCNTGLKAIADVPDYTVQQKANREAELRFLRAFYYWHIVETWGGVHFTTEPTQGAITTANRTPVDTFYNQIFRDLDFAVKNLGAAVEYGHATVPVAKAFLARMDLTRGKNAEAASLANDVIKNYGYILQPKYIDLWNMGNLKNKETIWAIDYSTNLSNNDLSNSNTYSSGHYRGSNNGHMMFLMVYDQAKKDVLIRDVNNGRPFNRYMPTLALLNLFDMQNDSRFAGSFQTVWYANKAGGNINGIATKIGDTAVYCPNAIIPVSSQPAKYLTYDLPKVYGSNGVPAQRQYYLSLSKFKDSTRAGLAEAQSARDVFVIRLAEMYLIAAEAKLNLGDKDSAAYFINQVRTRAAFPGRIAQMQILPSQVTIDFILDERAREFAGEQLRWFDLKRTGKLITRIQTMNPDAAQFVKPYHLLRPIPQGQMDAISNKDVFTQNPNYN